jgi:hypothetical protein
MTRDAIIGTARQMAEAERFPVDGPVGQQAVMRWIDRLGHVLNMIYAIELKERELAAMRADVRQRVSPAVERTEAELNELLAEVLERIALTE